MMDTTKLQAKISKDHVRAIELLTQSFLSQGLSARNAAMDCIVTAFAVLTESVGPLRAGEAMQELLDDISTFAPQIQFPNRVTPAFYETPSWYSSAGCASD